MPSKNNNNYYNDDFLCANILELSGATKPRDYYKAIL